MTGAPSTALARGRDLGGFDPVVLHDLPEPAARWLRHSLAPGAALHTSVELDLRGRIKLGRWTRFTAWQRLNALEGYVWAERTSLLGWPVHGQDVLRDGRAEMRHALLGGLPLVSGSGPDLTRSGYGRLAAELVYTPAAALDPRVTWDQLGWHTAVARVALPIGTVEVLLEVARDGQLSAARCRRWAKRGGRPWGPWLFEVRVLAEGSHGGATYPARVLAGYSSQDLRWPKGAFLEQSVLRYRPSAAPLPLVLPDPAR